MNVQSKTVRGRFISLEGLEGVGKTTNREFILEHLREHGVPVVVSREPGGTELGESLRKLILSEKGVMRPTTELLMVVASRLEHVDQVIEPALASGHWVVCDRFIDASHAYQGAGRELGSKRVSELHALVGLTLQPDLTLLLDMPPSDGLARTRQRGGTPDRIEREAAAFFERARAAYLARAAADPKRISVIDASRPLEQVQQALCAAMASLLTDRIDAGVGPLDG